MLIKVKKSWEISENHATPESAYINRRSILTAMGLGLASTAIGGSLASNHAYAAIDGIPAERNLDYTLDREISPEEEATTYTNFYEFGSSKNIWRKAKKLKPDRGKLRSMVWSRRTSKLTQQISSSNLAGRKNGFTDTGVLRPGRWLCRGLACRSLNLSRSLGLTRGQNISDLRPSLITLLPLDRGRDGILGHMLKA